MRNYASPSRNYYVNELKNNRKNLNKSVNKLDLLEENLDKLLVYSFRFFHPFFKDDEYDKSNHYYSSKNDVDNDFDAKIERHLPRFILTIMAYFTKLYHKLIGKSAVKKVVTAIKKFYLGVKNKMFSKIVSKTFKIFKNKSSP